MSSLEDLMPEMAGVFAAQESALENCVAVLTTQLRNLATDTNYHVKRIGTLEASHKTLLTTITALQQEQANALQQQQQQQKPEQIHELPPSPIVDLDGFKATLVDEMTLQTSTLVQNVLAAQLTTIEDKLTTQMNERMLETSNRAFLTAQQSEEAMQARLELLEKKFEYLSKIKMEIRDLGKRMDKQDQTLDDLRTGLALLAKSVGSDEINDEDDAEEHQGNKGEISLPMPTLMAVVVDEEVAAVEALTGHGETVASVAEPPSPTSATPQSGRPRSSESSRAQSDDGNRLTTAEGPPEAVVDAEAQDPLPPQPEQLPEDTTPMPMEKAASSRQLLGVAPPTPTQPEDETSLPSVEQPVEQQVDSIEDTSDIKDPSPRPQQLIDEPTQELAVVSDEGEVDAGGSDEESENRDDFLPSSAVELPLSVAATHPHVQHMTTSPNLSTVAYSTCRCSIQNTLLLWICSL